MDPLHSTLFFTITIFTKQSYFGMKQREKRKTMEAKILWQI